MRGDIARTEPTETGVGTIAVPWLTIPAMLADNLVRHAQRTAVVDGDVRLTYAQLAQHMQRIAAALAGRDIGRGDAIAIWAPNSWQWVASALACWWRGCTVVPIPARGRILDALPILQATRARWLFTCSAAGSGKLPSLIAQHLLATGASLRAVCPQLEAIVDMSGEDAPAALGPLDVWQWAAIGQGLPPVPHVDVAGEDTCAILFTSGSTGQPKGVLRRHEQVLRNRWITSCAHGYSREDRLLVVSEFSHTLGLHGNLLRCLMLGATLVIAQTRHPPELAALLRAERITAMGAPPSLFAGLLRERVDGESACGQLRLALTGAQDIPPALVRGMIAAGIGTVISGYGMTECDTISSTGLTDSADTVATTVGRPEAGQEVRITDDSGAAVPHGVAGEIWVRGYAVTAAYFGAAGQAEPATDAQGWLHSGDMGRFTADGRLQILGRKKDVMTIHGYTLYPAEVETLLSRSGLLRDVAVIGIPHATAGELCVAFLVPADPATFALKRLRLWARDNMADYKIPGRFVLLGQLPLNRAGKVDRLALRSRLEARPGSGQ